MKRKKIIKYWHSVIIVIIIALISWGLFSIIHTGIKEILSKWVTTNIYYQNGIIVLAGLILLLVLGYGLKKAINKVIGR